MSMVSDQRGCAFHIEYRIMGFRSSIKLWVSNCHGVMGLWVAMGFA